MTTLSRDTELGAPVELGKIEARLRELWDADDASSKASLMNLAVYSEQAGALERNQKLVQRVTREQACRVLLIEMDREAAEASSEAWIGAHCHLIGGQKSVCSEQIAFRLKGKEPGRLRNLVFSHCESDLPLVFWWQGDISDRFSERLYSQVDRLIVDSSTWSNPVQGWELVIHAESWTEDGLVVQDLEWTRSFHHRMALAALLDEPASRDLLSELDEVRVGCHPHHRLAALMLLAWMAEQAGWIMASGLDLGDLSGECGTRCLTMAAAGGREFSVHLEFDESLHAVGCLELKSARCVASVCHCSSELKHIKVRLTGPASTIETLHPAPPEDEAGLLAEQLSRGGRNSLFRKILPRLVSLLERFGNPPQN